MRDDAVYLRHIAESIELIEQYLAGADGAPSEQLFLHDLRTQDAVLRRLETLADAAGHLSDALKARHPHVPWRQIVAFRNVLAHAYTTIRLDRVWEAITADLQALKTAVASELGSDS
jgi:uncharacterized protein with HEPN domain